MIPSRVSLAQFIAAWARAESCDAELHGGQLALRGRYAPSHELEQAFTEFLPDIIGSLIFAIPILMGPDERAFAASWSRAWGPS